MGVLLDHARRLREMIVVWPCRVLPFLLAAASSAVAGSVAAIL
jgi:hypothetical protein